CYQMLLIKLRFYIKKTPIYGCFFIFIFTKKWIFVLKLGNSGFTTKYFSKYLVFYFLAPWQTSPKMEYFNIRPNFAETNQKSAEFFKSIY
ncbi:hypothetical protein, partial [Mesomycoplasma ovipneumoniae]|uniref:hypothetical protein n=1 Tax=Mesomycoplasma ovipneumoniae TaxID=29562 RepID=UPI0030808D8F